jgi:hypothetical protein
MNLSELPGFVSDQFQPIVGYSYAQRVAAYVARHVRYAQRVAATPRNRRQDELDAAWLKRRQKWADCMKRNRERRYAELLQTYSREYGPTEAAAMVARARERDEARGKVATQREDARYHARLFAMQQRQAARDAFCSQTGPESDTSSNQSQTSDVI